MILRIAAAVALIAGFGALAAYLHMMGRLPTSSAAEKHLRRMKDRVAQPAAAAPTSYDAIAALPKSRPLPEYAPLERAAVSLEGYVQSVVRASDDDLHLEIVPVPRMPGEPRAPYVTGEITPQWRRGSANWNYARLVEAFRPILGGVTPWPKGTRRVRVTGWLLYDSDYESKPAVYGPQRLSSWELHPVTRIELWSDSLRGFVEYPR